MTDTDLINTDPELRTRELKSGQMHTIARLDCGRQSGVHPDVLEG